MRIVNEDNQENIDTISLFLNPNEAKELADSLKQLLVKPDRNHAHISNSNYQRELTIYIYTHDNLKYFSEEVQQMLSGDE